MALSKSLRCGTIFFWGAWLAAVFATGSCAFASDVRLSKGQTVYVPVYSFIYYGNKLKKIDLTATLSIRNTDPVHSIEVRSVNYHDSNGKLIKKHLDDSVPLGPLASTHFQVAESDLSGGLGASFLVKWSSSKEVSAPIVESVLIGTISAQGISFVCRGEVVRDQE